MTPSSRWLHPAALAVTLLTAVAPHAQVGGADTTVTLSSLRPPDAPGFVLLGGAPRAVERPGTPRALALSAVTRATEGDLFDQFAVQVAPFWLNGYRGLSYETYAKAPRPDEAFRRTLALSAMTDRLDVGLAEPVPAVALGVRFSLATGRIDTTSTEYRQQLRAARQILATLAADADSLRRAAEAADSLYQYLVTAQRSIPFGGDEWSALEALRGQRSDELVAQIDLDKTLKLAEATETIGTLPERRVGWVWDVAGGGAVVFPDDEFDAMDVYRLGVWTTAGYERQGGAVLGVARLLDEDGLAGSDAGLSLDVGGRLAFDAPGGRLSASLEGVYRAGLSADLGDRYRVSGLVEYMAGSGETVALTLGRDFEGAPTGNVLALLRLVTDIGGDVRAPIRTFSDASR